MRPSSPRVPSSETLSHCVRTWTSDTDRNLVYCSLKALSWSIRHSWQIRIRSADAHTTSLYNQVFHVAAVLRSSSLMRALNQIRCFLSWQSSCLKWNRPQPKIGWNLLPKKSIFIRLVMFSCQPHFSKTKTTCVSLMRTRCVDGSDQPPTAWLLHFDMWWAMKNSPGWG